MNKRDREKDRDREGNRDRYWGRKRKRERTFSPSRDDTTTAEFSTCRSALSTRKCY